MDAQDTITVRKEKDVSIGEAALTMAIGILVERVSRLPQEDKQELYQLMKGLGTANGREEMEAICIAMREVLDQEPAGVRHLEINGDRPERLQKWVNFVAEKVREVRQKQELTQVQLAELSGLPQSHISRIEQSKLSPSRATIEKIAAALKYPVNYFDPSAE